MLIEVKVPVLAESVSEATLVNWHKKAGEFVRVDENLVDLETDKVVLEVVAPKSGVIREIRKNDGANVLSDEVIAVIDTDGQASNDASVEQKPIPAEQKQASVAQKPTAVIHQIAESKRPSAELFEAELKGLGPAVRKLITEYELDTSMIIGTGKGGRITKSDVIKHIKTLGQRSQAENTAMPAPPATTEVVAPPTALNLSDDRLEKRVPMSRLRARVAQRLKEAQNTAAILTTFNEVNMQPVMDLRNKYKDEFLARHEMKLGFMSFFAKACTEALRQHPIINASVDGKDIVYHGYYDIGIAVGSPRGLVVPILRDVDQMSFADIEKAINGYAKKAQDGKLSLEDLTGGTFSISNGGVYGSMLSTPILNPPQSAILGMHSIQQRAVVENGNIVARPMMYLALSYDHRIVDGRDAVLFLITVKQALEDPARMLLDL